ARADAAREAQRASRLLAYPEQQRAEARARAAGVGVADDDEFLPLQALHLEPALRALFAVAVVRALRHDALEAEPAGLGEHRGTVALDVLAVADRVGRVGDELFEQRLARAERRAAQVPAVEVQQIERDEHDRGVVRGDRIL